jgi:CRP-like cAMP-binding protein
VDKEDLQADYRDDITQTYWSFEMLVSIRQQYAEYMGPAAESLIHHAIQQTTDPYHLYRLLAQDIANAEEREAFIQAGPDSPALELGVGGFFGELALLTGQAPSNTLPTAKVETELLVITVQTMQPLMAQSPELLETLGARLATYYTLSNEQYDRLMEEMHTFYRATSSTASPRWP